MLRSLAPGLISLGTGAGATLCCVIPLMAIALGLGSGSFLIATIGEYRPILLPILYPLGIVGLAGSYWLYFRRKHACDRMACRLEWRWTNLTLLVASTLLMAAVTYVDFFM
jgi:hypothetical protein